MSGAHSHGHGHGHGHGPAVHDDPDVALDLAPGDEHPSERGLGRQIRNYSIGLIFAAALTACSFWAAQTHLVYGPSIPMLLTALAVAQMGVHLVFFLHLTSSPDNTNNILALGFGLLIVCLVVFGSLWIMDHLNHNMPPMGTVMTMQR